MEVLATRQKQCGCFKNEIEKQESVYVTIFRKISPDLVSSFDCQDNILSDILLRMLILSLIQLYPTFLRCNVVLGPVSCASDSSCNWVCSVCKRCKNSTVLKFMIVENMLVILLAALIVCSSVVILSKMLISICNLISMPSIKALNYVHLMLGKHECYVG